MVNLYITAILFLRMTSYRSKFSFN